MNEIVCDAPGANAGYGVLDRLLRRRLLAQLGGLGERPLEVADSLGTVELGGTDQGVTPLRIRVDDPGFYRAVAGQGSVGAGKAYIDGLWRCDDLVGLVRSLVLTRDRLDRMEHGLARLGGLALRGWNALRRNTRTGSRRNIAEHYDLGNEFFALFLSPDLMYSSAMFTDAADTLEVASTRKLEHICRKLDLQPGDRVIEIGGGWGGFALHAAQHYGCHVTTTTISREQHDLARSRIEAAGLSDRVTLLLEDYRDLSGCYDKLVSIEMIEAIGAEYLDTYFGKVGALLAPHGLALVQAITIEDHRYAQALRSVDFIKRYVFPGSFMPSIAAMMAAKSRASDLGLVHLEDFGDSYARTLEAWRARFLMRKAEVRTLGYDERFIRLWEFYLAYCEGGFRERSVGVSQLLLAKPRWRRGAVVFGPVPDSVA